MIVVRFFAALREVLGVDTVSLDADGISCVDDVLSSLSARGDEWRDALSAANLLVAINHAHAHADSPVQDGDEVAIFPPVTGG